MRKLKYQKYSIVYKLTRLILGIIILQTFLFGFILIQGGVVKQANSNAYQLFHDKVNNRKDYVQREMKNNWINFDPYVTNISKLLSRTDLKDNPNSFFETAIEELIPMLRTTQATGAYIILYDETSEKDNIASLYLRDYDPIMNAYSDDDIYMVSGPSELAKKLMIPLDQTWRYSLKLTEKNSSFVRTPYEHASITSKATLLGYWSKPFKLQSDDVSIITYSMPLFDSIGELKGVIGIDITLNYLTDYFPATELQPKDSLGYLIAYSEDDGETLEPIISGGALQKRMIDEDEPLVLESVDEDLKIYNLVNHSAKEKIYASIEKIGLYAFNTPFEQEQWYLVGFMREDYLLSYSNNIKQILLITLLSAIGLGSIGAILISFRITKPIVALARQVKDSDLDQELMLKPTGLYELDELSKTIEVTNHLMLESASRLTKIVELFGLPIGAFEVNHTLKRVFTTDNYWSIIGLEGNENTHMNEYDSFLDSIQRLLSTPEVDETDIYKICEEPERWVRFKQTDQEDTWIGVVLDVTNEMLEKKEIKKERDHDPLTNLLNRKGFQWAFEKWSEEKSTKSSALVMFDLDRLKQINDSYGHKWGDHYIVSAVERLENMSSDKQMILGRRSGDEFILLLHGFESHDDILDVMNSFYNRLESELVIFPDGKPEQVRISSGIMWIDHRDFSYEELLHFADEALYEAKRHNKGRYVVSEM
ncbi:MAG: sensor domain-containing diguanylate cyclase [Clostridiales bacterium]|nr:sensor domain-containing diguanylate cyclase [Clostridiales bacterium]